MRWIALLAILVGLVLSLPSIAQAEIVARINLSSQRMAVFVNGAARYNWPVSTAQARLSHADRNLQADRARALPPLLHL